MRVMNTAQRRFVLVALVVLAVGLHLWNLRWDYERTEPYPTRYGPLGRSFATVSWESAADLPDWMLNYRPAAKEPDAAGAAPSVLRDLIRDRTTWVDEKWQSYRYELAAYKREGLPFDSWDAYLRRVAPAKNYFGLWTVTSEDAAWLWGVFAPLGVLGIGAFLILGWRKPTPTKSAEIDSTNAPSS